MKRSSFQSLSFYLRQWLSDKPDLDPARGEQLQNAFHNALSALHPEIADHAVPLCIRDGELLIAASSPVWAAKLRYQHATLLQQLQRSESTREAPFAQVRSLRVLIPGER